MSNIKSGNIDFCMNNKNTKNECGNPMFRIGFSLYTWGNCLIERITVEQSRRMATNCNMATFNLGEEIHIHSGKTKKEIAGTQRETESD